MRSFKSMAVTLLALYALLSWSMLGTASGHSDATPWLQGLTNGVNTKCCGEDDCIPVESIEVIATNEKTIHILINGSMIAQIRRTSVVPITCDKRPHICFQKSIWQDNKVTPCWWKNPDGSLGFLPVPECHRCDLIPYCPS